MADRYWLGTTSSDPAIAANWAASSGGAPGASVPVSGDTATFDSAGNNASTLTAAMALAGLTTEAGYTAKLDLATFNLTMDDGADIILDQAGEFDCGSGTISLTNGNLDSKDVGTWTRGSSTILLAGACVVTGNSAHTINNLTFAAGSALTIHADTVTSVTAVGTVTIGGSLVLDKRLRLNNPGQLVINAGANITGSDLIYLNYLTSGAGLTTLQAGAVVAVELQFARPAAGVVLAAGTYAGLVQVVTWDSAATLRLSAGSYAFNGGLKLRQLNAATVLLDNSTNGPTIQTTDLVIDLDGTGGITIDDSGQAVDWDISGDIIDEITGAGVFAWTHGTGTITFSGTADQDIDTDGVSLDAVVIDKTAGIVTITSGDITLGGDSQCGGLVMAAGYTGTIDLDGRLLTITGDIVDNSAGAYTLDCAWATLLIDGTAAQSIDLGGVTDDSSNYFDLIQVSNTSDTVTIEADVYCASRTIDAEVTLDEAAGEILELAVHLACTTANVAVTFHPMTFAASQGETWTPAGRARTWTPAGRSRTWTVK